MDNSIFESVRFLNEDKENLDTFINELSIMQEKANKMNCQLILEAVDFKKILDWIKEKWRKLIEFLIKKKQEFLNLLSKLKDKNKIEKAIEYLEKNDDTFETNTLYFINNIKLDLALDLLKKLEELIDDMVPKLLDKNDNNLYKEKIDQSIANILSVDYENNRYYNEDNKYRELINYDEKVHIKDKYKETQKYDLNDIKNFINSIEKKNDIRNKEVDKLEKEYTTSFNNLKPGPIPQDLKILQDHYISYLSLINLEFEMYYDISNFLSGYSRKIEYILGKAEL